MVSNSVFFVKSLFWGKIPIWTFPYFRKAPWVGFLPPGSRIVESPSLEGSIDWQVPGVGGRSGKCWANGVPIQVVFCWSLVSHIGFACIYYFYLFHWRRSSRCLHDRIHKYIPPAHWFTKFLPTSIPSKKTQEVVGATKSLGYQLLRYGLSGRENHHDTGVRFVG